MRKLFWRKRLSGTYVVGGEKAGVIGYNGHFCAIVAHLVKHPILEHPEYIQILFESGVKVPIVALGLRGGAVEPLESLSPVLL